MPNTPTREAARNTARAELMRLLPGLDYYRDWQIGLIRARQGTVTQADLNAIVEPGARFAEMFDAARGVGYRQILKDVKEWYARTAADLTRFARDGDDEVRAAISAFLAGFRREIGFDFHAEAGFIDTAAAKALRRGKITGAAEYEMFHGLEDDTDQTAMSADDRAQISALLRAYEARTKTQR